mgnify:FL=1
MAIWVYSLNLYVRDTETLCKNRENIGNKRIVCVKNSTLLKNIQQLFAKDFEPILVFSDYQRVTSDSVSLT